MTSRRYKKIAVNRVSLEKVEMTDDLHGVDEQIRCILGDIEQSFKDKGYTEFEIIVRGRKP